MNKFSLSLYSFFIVFVAIMTGCDVVNKNMQQSNIELLADNLTLNYQLIESKKTCDILDDKPQQPCYVFQLSLTMPMKFEQQGWEIYFIQVNPIISVESNHFAIKRISGELHRLYATEQFEGFDKDKTVQILFTTKAVELNATPLLPNFYVMSEGLKATLIKSSLLN